MQGLEATFDDLSFEGGDSPQRVLPKIVPLGAALAFAGAVSVWALHWQGSTLPDTVLGLWPSAPTATHAISKPFADIAIDANLAAQLTSGAPVVPSQQMASLETAPRLPSAPFPLPSLEAFPPSSPAIPPVGSVPLPPGRDVPEIGETESFPLPPARPPGFGAPTTAPETHASRPDTAIARPPAAPADNRNIIEKLFGWAHSSSPVVASTTSTRTAATQPVVAERDSAAASGEIGRASCRERVSSPV